MDNETKPTIVLSFQKDGKNGGPYLSHTRIMESSLKNKYNFVPLFIPRSREVMKPSVFRSLVEEIKSANADIFQFTGLQLDGYISYRIGKSAKIPMICAIRGSTDEAVYVNPILRKVTSFCEKKTLKGSDACYAVSRYVSSWKKTRKYANNLYGFIYNFYNFNTESNKLEDRRKIRDELGINNEDVVIVSTGRIIIEKGYKTIKNILIDGKPWKNVKFLIVGDGNYRSEFENEMRSNRMQETVIFLGYRKDIATILNASDIFLSCTWHETFGNSIIEGSYHKLPVIASRVGGVPEIVDNEVTGYLVDYLDEKTFLRKIKMLVENPDLRRELGEHGYQYVTKKFDPKGIEAKLDELYQEVLKRKMW